MSSSVVGHTRVQIESVYEIIFNRSFIFGNEDVHLGFFTGKMTRVAWFTPKGKLFP